MTAAERQRAAAAALRTIRENAALAEAGGFPVTAAQRYAIADRLTRSTHGGGSVAEGQTTTEHRPGSADGRVTYMAAAPTILEGAAVSAAATATGLPPADPPAPGGANTRRGLLRLTDRDEEHHAWAERQRSLGESWGHGA